MDDVSMESESRDYFSCLEGDGAGTTNGTPLETPYYTPRPSLPRKSSRRPPSRQTSNSPPPAPVGPATLTTLPISAPQLGLGIEGEEKAAIIDPRSFTPTLHASLVSEILGLRREVESKVQFIGELESDLANTKAEKDDAVEKLATSEKERRSLKRQFQQVEHGTIAALEELAKDRDSARASNADLKSRLEAAQKKVSVYEKDTGRVQSLWQQDKEIWQVERRNLERKVHVTETRLRNVLMELAAQNVDSSNDGHNSAVSIREAEDEDDSNTKDSGFGEDSDVASVASAPHSSPRKTYMASPGKRGSRKLVIYRASLQSLADQEVGVSLADELQFDDTDLEDPVEDAADSAYDRLIIHNGVTRHLPSACVRYSDANSQTEAFLTEQALNVSTSLLAAEESSLGADEEMRSESLTLNDGKHDIRASQTAAVPMSPPDTPRCDPSPLLYDLENTKSIDAITSSGSVLTVAHASTQTIEPSRNEAPSTPPYDKSFVMNVPEIVIQPPLSAPSSPGEAVLPPHSKTVGCQTTHDLIGTRDASMQTEEIRFNKELLAKLPAHLHPDAVKDSPASATISQRGTVSERLPIRKPASMERMKQKVPSRRKFARSSSPDLDDIPSSPPPLLSEKTLEDRLKELTIPTKPLRSYENGKSPVYSTPASVRNLKHARLLSQRPSPITEDEEAESRSPSAGDFERNILPVLSNVTMGSSNNVPLKFAQSVQGTELPDIFSSKSNDASVASTHPPMPGPSTFAQRSRTSSNASVISSAVSNKSHAPPFAIPNRLSSRNPFPQSKSEGSASPTPRSSAALGSRIGQRPVRRKPSLRKARSVTTIPRAGSRACDRSRSPELPVPIPVQRNTLQAPEDLIGEEMLPQEQVIANFESLSPPSTGHTQIARASQGTVVDAIATCMVGEWMLKYVRKRKSFGVGDSPAEQVSRPGTDGSVNVTGNGIRHRRWVWLSPYERAIMWSGRQPQSNNALMGKNGRKLVIQSVLDVRDETPLPRNHGIAQPFQRSILILTPARALKFTALDEEKHYTWLTALSFLAHSPLLSTSLPAPPSSAKEGTDAERISSENSFNLRRTSVRDSLRLNRDKPRTPLSHLNPIITGTHNLSDDFEGPSPAPNVPTVPWVQAHSGFTYANPIIHDLAEAGVDDSAEPPSIPRFHEHGRKRSLTTGTPAPSISIFSKALGHTSVAMPRYPSSTVIGFAVSPGEYGGGHGSSVTPLDTTTTYLPTGLRSHPVTTDVKSNRSSRASMTSMPAMSRESLRQSDSRSQTPTIRMDAFAEADESNHFSPRAPEDLPHSLLNNSSSFMPEARRPTSLTPLPEMGVAATPRAPRISSSVLTGRLSPLNTVNDSRRSGIVYPDDFDAFDPFKNFST